MATLIYTPYTRVPFSPHPQQHLLFLVILLLVILTDVRYDLIFIYVCISLMVSDLEHLFTWALCMSSLERRLFRSIF